MSKEIATTQTFHLLLSTTEELIHEKGCKNTTLQEIMNRTGLSKGAIYHYVKSKDELFGLVLKSRLESVNEGFFASVKNGEGLDHPLSVISQGIKHAQEKNDVTNLIFIYLLSQTDNPAIEQMLKQVYQHGVETGMKWIETGQKNGVIPHHLDAKKTAELFQLISYGFRIRSIISPDSTYFTVDDMHGMMERTLRGK